MVRNLLQIHPLAAQLFFRRVPLFLLFRWRGVELLLLQLGLPQLFLLLLLLEFFLVIQLSYLMLFCLDELQDVVCVVNADEKLEAHALLHGLDELARLDELPNR